MTTKTTIEKGPDGKQIKTIETVDSSNQNSIEINQNAKGEISWKVKVYEDDAAMMEKKLETYIGKAIKVVSSDREEQK